MSQADAVIRPYGHDEDNKLIRFMVAKAAMESLAVANRKVSLHPLTVSLWIALSSIVVQMFNLWPDPRFGFWGYLRPLPPFAAFTLPIIFFIDWYQRSHFEQHSMDILKRPDMAAVEEYYTRTPASGLWIYEFGDSFVGLIAVDASKDSLSNETVSESSPTSKGLDRSKSKSKNSGKESSTIAVIRHLYIAEPYRVVNAQDDLIAFAVKHIFESSTIVEKIRAIPSPICDYLGRSLRSAGFDVCDSGEKVGILGWTTLGYELTREKWEGLQRDN